MSQNDPLKIFSTKAETWSELPLDASEFLPGMKELLDSMKAAEAESESLRRYRGIRDRMGKPEKYIMGAPDFPYSIHVS